MIKALVTGGCGFIGSHFIRMLKAKCPAWHIVNLDKLTYAGSKSNLKDLPCDNYEFHQGDICNRFLLSSLMQDVDFVFNFAAESHVDNSIHKGSYDFVRTNVQGTQCLLEAARMNKVSRFVQISTDEVYGSLSEIGEFTERTPLSPTNPYAASKAAADMLALSYHYTHQMDIIITRCSNNYGPNQHPEKMIPCFISKLLDGFPVPIYGDGQQVRDWIYVKDHCKGIFEACNRGSPGQVYNFGGNNEITNIDLTKKIVKLMKITDAKLTFVEDRPGHDRRYAMNFKKAQLELGWRPETLFETGLAETIKWYKDKWE